MPYTPKKTGKLIQYPALLFILNENIMLFVLEMLEFYPPKDFPFPIHLLYVRFVEDRVFFMNGMLEDQNFCFFIRLHLKKK